MAFGDPDNRVDINDGDDCDDDADIIVFAYSRTLKGSKDDMSSDWKNIAVFAGLWAPQRFCQMTAWQ